jgi:PhoD-like phosphatase
VPDLVLGPLLRYADASEATVWVETDVPCEVTVSTGDGGAVGRSRTFGVGGHHYALVRMSGLEPGKTYDYEVLLDGALVWPEPGSPFPPSRIRTLGEGEPVKLVFGSCRISAPHEPPHTLGPEDDERGLGVDALYSTAMRLRDEPAGGLPHALVLLGDQIYAHKPPFDTLDFIRSRRDTSAAPGEVVANFVEYARLYRDAWGDPAIRWLLSTVSSAMIFDDHEVGDDWNVSAAWVEEVRHQPHWNAQIAGGHVSYLVYQHLGNLSPQELQDNDLYAEIRAADDAWPLLRDAAHRSHRDSTVARWSFCRDLGNVRLLAIDSRGGRVLDEGRRSMVDAGEWAWIEGRATGGFDHLLLGTSLPLMLGPGMHHLQAWNEKLCSGAWGRRAAKWAEDLRRSQDLDHWASFHASFGKMVGTIRSVVAGERGASPSTVLVLSGDVHHGYLAEASLNGAKPVSRVYQPSAPPATPSPARSRASSPRPGAGAPPAPEACSPAWPA